MMKTISFYPSNEDVKENDHINVVVDYDNTINVCKHKGMIHKSDTVIINSLNRNRMFRKVLYEICVLIKQSTELVITLEDNNNLKNFGVKYLIEEIFPGDFRFNNQDENRISFIREHVGYEKKYHVEKFTGVTIGLLTRGDEEFLSQFVNSYKESINNVENVELIIVSPVKMVSRDNKIFSVEIPMDISLSKKKNKICEMANFSDIVILHDRYLLDETFFRDFIHKRSFYTIGTCKVKNSSGSRGFDWAVVSSKNYTFSRGGLLDYRSYSEYSYVQGGVSIIKKEFWKVNKWNENLDWKEHEDVEISRRAQRKGEIISLIDTHVTVLKDNYFEQNPLIPYNQEEEILIGPPVAENRIKYI